MGSVGGRAKRLESVIGICLLAILLLTGVGVFVRQSKYDISKYGMDVAAVSKIETQNSKSETAPELSSLAPAGFETLSKAEVYNADSLYEKIDGKAPLYLEAGFKELTTQRFAETSDPNLWMELYIYDMGNIKNAFCVYSEQRRAEAEASESMPLAYGTSNSMYLVHGKYYVEIIGSSESDKMVSAITTLAQNAQANLDIEPGGGITEFAFFPQENLVTDSFKLYAASAFGCEKLTDIFTAKYKVEGKSVTAFIGKKADAKEAEATAESYRKFLTENGAVTKNTDNKTFAGKIMDLYGATEIVFTEGPFIAGVHEAEDQQAAETTAKILINKLNSINNETTKEIR